MKNNEKIIDEKEYEAAEKQAKSASATFTLKLSKPFTWMGKTYEKLEFDFDALTGTNFLAIEEVMSTRGKLVISPTFSGEFLTLMAAKACGMGDDALCALPFYDFSKIRSMARSFLMKTELT